MANATTVKLYVIFLHKNAIPAFLRILAKTPDECYTNTIKLNSTFIRYKLTMKWSFLADLQLLCLALTGKGQIFASTEKKFCVLFLVRNMTYLKIGLIFKQLLFQLPVFLKRCRPADLLVSANKPKTVFQFVFNISLAANT